MNINKNPIYDHSNVNEYNLGISHSSIAQNELRGWRRREGETERINTHQEDAW